MYELLNIFLKLLSTKRKAKFWLLLMYMLFYAGIELVSVAVLSGYIVLLINFDSVTNIAYFQTFINYFNIDLADRKNLLITAGIVVLVIIVLKNLSKLVLTYGVSRYSSNISVDVGKYLTQGFLNMPYEWHMLQKTSDLILVIQWRSNVGMMISSLLNIVADTILAIIMLAAVVVLNVTLSVAVIGLVGVVGLFIYSVVKKRVDYNSTVLKNCSLEIHRSSSRTIYGFKEMKIYEMENEGLEEFLNPAQRYSKANALKDLYIPLPSLLIETLGVLFLVSYVTIILVINNQSAAQITSELAMFVLIIWRTLPAVSRILNNFTKFRKVLPVVQTVRGYVEKIAEQTKTFLDPKKPEKQTLNKNMMVNGLNFKYRGSETRTLENVSFTIEKGMSVGVVGFSGSGKSTLADLLVGLLMPERGTLTINDAVVQLEGQLIEIGNLAYVSQAPFFFDGTLAENIAFSIHKESIDFELLKQSCNMAALKDMLESLPDGFDTIIGERGVRLSGGQLQRVAIARALYRKPDIIVFDESTSSLDLKSEKAIQETINNLAGDITLIIIAHRLETVEKCDHIMWMEKGRIVNSGSASEILPKYRESLR